MRSAAEFLCLCLFVAAMMGIVSISDGIDAVLIGGV
jgi:hypothetical protein